MKNMSIADALGPVRMKAGTAICARSVLVNLHEFVTGLLAREAGQKVVKSGTESI